MIENIKDTSVTDYSIPHTTKSQKASQESILDHKDLKGILFLGVKGDINIDVNGDKSKLDFLA